MTLLTPVALALTALAVPIVLMYILKLRRQRHIVSSTILWQRALDDVQANAPWQRLRPSILLLLQLLALLGLALALAGPAYTSSRRFHGDLILIVDESYGMQAHDVRPSRFAAALAQAHALANQLPPGNVASVIGMGSQPHPAIAESSDGGAISAAIDSLHDGVSSPNFLAALSLAASLARDGQATRAVVLTSRESGISTVPIQVPFPVQLVRIGGRLHDLGITAFSAADSGSQIHALARVGNFGAGTAHSDLYLWANGQLVDVRPLTIAPGRQTTLFWTSLPASTHTLHLRLMHADDVTADKQAWAVPPGGPAERILLVGKLDYFLQTALNLDPAYTVSTIKPSAYTPALAREPSERYDLVVFDGMLPSTLPAAPVLLASPPAGRVGPIAFGRYQTGGTVMPVSGAGRLAQSLLHYVDLSDVHIARQRSVTLPGWLLPVVSAGSRPLLVAGENTQGATDRRLAALTFSLQESDWPLRVSYPILIQNLLHYLLPGTGPTAGTILAGQPVQLFPPSGTRSITITRPDGGTDRMAPPFAPFADTAEPGLYTATMSGAATRRVSFAVDFFPSRPAPATGKQRVLIGQSTGGTNRSVQVPIGVAWAAAVIVLGILTAEWWFAFRR